MSLQFTEWILSLLTMKVRPSSHIAKRLIQQNSWKPLKTLLPPANEGCEGYVFTGVCLSTEAGGVCPTACWDTPSCADTPLGRQPPAQWMLGYGQQVGSMHQTGMHSCLMTWKYGFTQFPSDYWGHLDRALLCKIEPPFLSVQLRSHVNHVLKR